MSGMGLNNLKIEGRNYDNLTSNTNNANANQNHKEKYKWYYVKQTQK